MVDRLVIALLMFLQISCGMYHLQKPRRPVNLRVIKGRGAAAERGAANERMF